jgi:hemoglobin
MAGTVDDPGRPRVQRTSNIDAPCKRALDAWTASRPSYPLRTLLRYHDRMPDTPENQDPRTLYDIIGGEARLRELVDRFYDLMQLEGDFAGIHAMHPVPNDGSRDKLFMFLSGWMGGPNLFIERYGHPMLRARHLPFAIGTTERDQWLRCMAQALEDLGYDYDLRLQLMQAFFQTADWMRNKPH